MRALKFYQTGSLDDLHVEEVTVPIPAEGEVLVEVKAAAINPSDIKNVQGKMHETTVPRIPGRDFAGMIVKGQCPPGGQDMANRYRRSDGSAPNPRHGRIEHRLQHRRTRQ
jgi:NADPH:quinone reductase